MKNGLLIRVAVDSNSDGWNAPCRTNGRFCYVPIGDPNRSDRGSYFDHSYDEFRPFVTALGGALPPHLSGNCHLDPDFAHLTYGDWKSRGERIREFLCPGSFIVFWAGLRWLDGKQAGQIVCSIIGFFRVAHILNASSVGPLHYHCNAHTRYTASDDHTVVFADPSDSGRLKKHIPIGEHRVDAQRIRQEYLDAWGNLRRRNGELLKDGYIQLSGNPPIFNDPERFEQWFYRKRPEFVHANNV